MNKRQMTTCVLALLAITSLPTQAKNIEIKVAGSITPSGCTPTLSGASVDYGTMTSDSLTLDAYTTLDRKSLDLTITCDEPVKLAFETKNGRPNTLAGADEDAISGAGLSPISAPSSPLNSWLQGTAVVGLGLSGSGHIGGYVVTIGGISASGVSVQTISRDGSSGKWTDGGGNLYGIGVKKKISWKKGDVVEPVAVQALTMSLNVQAYINKASELDLTKPIVLDGLSTIELIYL